ncbi:MAG: glucosyltransferase domain-containing protein [Bacteroidota bacterium]|nr:glucosyltransferase domain-containing protein [Bacteroidota bacterium]
MNQLKQLFEDKKSLYVTLCISVLYVFPLAVIDYQYIDDVGRYLFGYGWQHDGRFMATLLGKIWSMNDTIFAIHPYSLFIGGVLLGFTGFIISKLFDLEQDKLLKWSSLLVLTAPPFLGNIVFKFDIIPMTLSLLCVVFPFLYFQDRKKFVSISLLGVFISLGLYQSATTVFLMVASYFLIKNLKEGQWRNFLVNVGIVIGVFLAATLCYVLVVRLLDMPLTRGEMIFSSNHFMESLHQNYLVFRQRMELLFNSSNYRVLFGFFVLINALSYILTSVQSDFKVKRMMLMPIVTLVILINYLLISGVNILLVESYSDLRIFNGFGIFLVLLMSFQSELRGIYRQIGRISAALLVLFSFVMISQFAFILSNQTKLQNAISQELTPYFRDKNIDKVAFRATLRTAPQNNLIYDKYPIFKNILSSPIGEYSAWTKQLLNTNDMLTGVEVISVEGKMCDFELVKETKLYHIRKIDESTLLIDFSREECN